MLLIFLANILDWLKNLGWEFAAYAIPFLAIFYGHDVFEWAQGRIAWLNRQGVREKFALALVFGFLAQKLAGAAGATLTTGDVTQFLESDYTAMLTGLGMVALRLSKGMKALKGRTPDGGA